MVVLFLSLLRKHLTLSFWAIAAAALGGIFLFEHIELHIFKGRLASCEAQNLQLQAFNQHLSASIRMQNDAIQALAQNSAAKKRELAILRRSRKASAAAASKARSIMQRSFKGDSCHALHQLLEEYIPVADE